MSTQDTTLPPPCGWPTMLELFIEASATLIRQAQAAECNEHNYEQLLSAVQRVTDYGQQGLSALTKQARAAIAAQAQQPATVKDSLTTQQAQQAQGVPVGMVKAMKDAIEGECDGLAITDAHAKAILQYVLAAAPQAEPQTPAPEKRLPAALGEWLTAIGELYIAMGRPKFEATEPTLGVVETLREAAKRLSVQAPAAEAEPQPEREPFTADVECVTDESGTDYSVAVRGPGIRNPLYSDVWLKKERQAAMLAKWLNDSVFPTMAGTKVGE